VTERELRDEHRGDALSKKEEMLSCRDLGIEPQDERTAAGEEEGKKAPGSWRPSSSACAQLAAQYTDGEGGEEDEDPRLAEVV
jgi:hypothetical protein